MIISRPTHIAANDIISFFFMAEYYSSVYYGYIICMYTYMCICIHMYIYVYILHIYFTHSSVGQHLGCFHVLAFVTSAAMNTGVCVSFLKDSSVQIHTQKWVYWIMYGCLTVVRVVVAEG